MVLIKSSFEESKSIFCSRLTSKIRICNISRYFSYMMIWTLSLRGVRSIARSELCFMLTRRKVGTYIDVCAPSSKMLTVRVMISSHLIFPFRHDDAKPMHLWVQTCNASHSCSYRCPAALKTHLSGRQSSSSVTYCASLLESDF